MIYQTAAENPVRHRIDLKIVGDERGAIYVIRGITNPDYRIEVAGQGEFVISGIPEGEYEIYEECGWHLWKE